MTRDARLEHWVDELLATPGLTSLRNRDDAWRVHAEESLAGLPYVGEGPLVDVGSGGGSPGLPLALVRPDLHVVLLEASRRKCDFLIGATGKIPNVEIVCARAEDHARGAGRDAYPTAVARALAPQDVALEWCLPLVRPGGVLVLYAGSPVPGLDGVAALLGAEGPDVHPVPGQQRQHMLVFRKAHATPDRFPRRAGMARKRPLLRLDSAR